MPTPDFILSLRKKIGNDLLWLPGAAAIVFNDAGDVLLGKRADTGRWSVIGGIIEPGEEPADTVVREATEETGVSCEVIRLGGIYMTPLVTYPNGNRAQYVVAAFACRATGGTPRVCDDESLAVGWFPTSDLPGELPAQQRQRIFDAMKPGPATFESSDRPPIAGAGGMSPYVRGLRAKVGYESLRMIGVSAVVMNDRGEVLLVRSNEIDNWMPVGGMVEPGEEPADAAVREVLEEAGVVVRAEHLVGIYGGPVVTYRNGDRVDYLTLTFRCRIVGGSPKPDGSETIDVRFFPADRLPPLRADHQRNIDHARARRAEAFFSRKGS
jgi:8-oxo-dGTP pyrophosphatase MutT (NUDIX family)